MNKGQIALEVILIDERLLELEEIINKAHSSSPTARMAWWIKNNPIVIDPRGVIGDSKPSTESTRSFWPTEEERENWKNTKDGVIFSCAKEDREKLRERRKEILKEPIEELKNKLKLNL